MKDYKKLKMGLAILGDIRYAKDDGIPLNWYLNDIADKKGGTP